MELFYAVFGAAIGGAAIYFSMRKDVKQKEKTLDEEIIKYHRVTTQITNVLNYNGTSFRQEDVD